MPKSVGEEKKAISNKPFPSLMRTSLDIHHSSNFDGFGAPTSFNSLETASNFWRPSYLRPRDIQWNPHVKCFFTSCSCLYLLNTNFFLLKPCRSLIQTSSLRSSLQLLSINISFSSIPSREIQYWKFSRTCSVHEHVEGGPQSFRLIVYTSNNQLVI